jgi:bacillithiol biosynthesis cysteine-adding enzyme BshC
VIRAISRDPGGSSLARSAVAGSLPEWYGGAPLDRAGWIEAAANVAAEFAGRPWYEALLPAFAPRDLAADRLRTASQPGGLVVTGGQQPGLFGGPLYVLHKAITLLEMADALSSLTGRAVAPVFWAATDDTDFAEASHVSVVRRNRLDSLVMPEPVIAGRAMAVTPLGDVSAQLARLEEACGSAPNSAAVDAVRHAYESGASVGSAYVSLLRALLHPLGVAVLDASHPAVRAAGHDTMARALTRADDVAVALTARSRDIVAAGFHPQVADVPNLSLVFETRQDGTRQRVPLRASQAAASGVPADMLGPNVLLRPVMERQILPTVTYVGGPGEIAYFAQVSAVAQSLVCSLPRIIPRWSGVLLESHIEQLLGRLGATIDDFADPHAMESRIARQAISPTVQAAMQRLRAELEATCTVMREDSQTSDPLARSIATMRAGVERRLARLERRYAAAVKRMGSTDLRDVETVRATLYPDGHRQERVLSFIPFLARYGDAVTHATREQARLHVAAVMNGG